MQLRFAAWIAVLAQTACFSESDVGSGDDAENESSDDAGTSLEPDTSSGAAATTMASSDASSATSDPDAESTTASPTCGDGVTDDDEACDDADDDELDGCTQACALGPRGLALATVTAPEPAGGGTIDVSLPCVDPVRPRPLLLGGLFGHRGGVSVDNAWTVSAGGGCSSIALVEAAELPAIELREDPIELPEQGNTFMQIDTWSLACPAGATPIGIDARIYSGTVPYIAALRLQCATLRIVEDAGAFAVALDSAAPSDWTATGTTHAEASSVCPAGSVAVGFRGAIDADATAIFALGPLCAEVTVVVGPG